MKRLLLVLLASIIAAAPLRAASLVEGTVWLKDGTIHLFRGEDRIEIPRKKRALRTFRNAFRKTKQRTNYRYDEIDSVVLWHSRTPDDCHTFVPLSQGWSRILLQTPRIRVLLCSKVGYTLYGNGGMATWARQGVFSTTPVEIYLWKQGETPRSLGRVNRGNNDAFRRRIAESVADDPELADRIHRSSTSRYKTLLLLRDYRTPSDHLQ